jgi:hypothetical protein
VVAGGLGQVPSVVRSVEVVGRSLPGVRSSFIEVVSPDPLGSVLSEMDCEAADVSCRTIICVRNFACTVRFGVVVERPVVGGVVGCERRPAVVSPSIRI